MIKGHTKIELTNVKTGEKKVVEKHNLVTNAVAKYFEFSPYLKDFFNIDQQPLVDSYFGGLLLFQDALEENADNYNLPAGNRMIGNGVVNYSSLNVPEFGSFNGEESSYSIEKGVVTRKYVYDFATSKANGSISTVCLTNPYMGYFGTGNYSGISEYKATPLIGAYRTGCLTSFRKSYLRPSYIFAKDIVKPASSENIILTFDYLKNCAYYTSRQVIVYSSSYSNTHFKNGKLTLYKVHFPFNSLNPTVYINNQMLVYDKIEIPTPSVFQNMSTNIKTSVVTNSDGIYLIIADTGSNSEWIECNSTFYVWKIGNDLNTSEVFTLTNTTADKLALSSYHNSRFQVVGDFLVYGYSKFYKFNLKNPNNAVEITFNKIPDLHSQDYSSCVRTDGKNNAIVYFAANTDKISSTYVSYRMDLINNRMDVMNGLPFVCNNDNYYYQTDSFPILHNKDFFAVFENQYNKIDSACSIFNNPFMLSTINNLPTPVEKTSDMTMKITYTLTSKIEPDEV